MKVLLDECLPIDFRHHIAGHEVHTAQFAGFKGLENGKLLSEAEAAGYALFLTVDQGIRGNKTWLDGAYPLLSFAAGRIRWMILFRWPDEYWKLSRSFG
jgi:hypothetical protein